MMSTSMLGLRYWQDYTWAVDDVLSRPKALGTEPVSGRMTCRTLVGLARLELATP
jgi:hypothetical protein